MTIIRCSASDQRITGDSMVNYATARSTGNYDNTADNLRVGQSYSSGHYYVYRSYLAFDTSSIPDGDTVTAVSLGLKIAQDYTTTSDFIMYLYDYNWKTTGPSTRDDIFDMGAAGATDATPANKETAECNIAGKTTGDWCIFTSVDTSKVNKTGTTKYALRSKRDADGSGTAPTGQEYLNFYSGDYATSTFRPYLDITHGTATGSRVTRLYASGVVCDNPLNQLG